jgi:hypothetical protein
MASPLNGPGDCAQIVGTYFEDWSHYDRAAFDAIPGERSIVVSNGDYTTCVITKNDDGTRTVHTMNPNAKTRETFSHDVGRHWTGSLNESRGIMPTAPVFISEPQTPLEWSALWDAMKTAYNAGLDVWTETTQHMSDEMLNAVPPAAMKHRAFLCGEPWTHNANGQAVYAAFRQLPGNVFHAKYMTANEFRSV